MAETFAARHKPGGPTYLTRVMLGGFIVLGATVGTSDIGSIVVGSPTGEGVGSSTGGGLVEGSAGEGATGADVSTMGAGVPRSKTCAESQDLARSVVDAPIPMTHASWGPSGA